MHYSAAATDDSLDRVAAPPEASASANGWLGDLVGPTAFTMPHRLVRSAWLGHIPFAFWLIDAHRPRVLVELGTHNGASYAAFCQAIAELGLASAAYAIDTWQGDPQAGFYGEEVFAELTAYHDRHYTAFSRLIRSTFDDALAHFAEGSIDLLHLDGYHTLDAVRHDFESWRSKLSSRAVVLLHDINVRERDFGAWRLWEELARDHPSFAFLHHHGWGVGCVGADQPPAVRRLIAAADDHAALASARKCFTRLGQGVQTAWDITEQLANRDQLQTLITSMTGDRDRLLGEVRAVTGDRDRLLGENSAVTLRAAKLSAAHDSSVAERNRFAAELATIDRERDFLREALETQKAELATTSLVLRQTQQDLAVAQHRLRKLKHSVYWRAIRPLRSAARAISRPLRGRRKPGPQDPPSAVGGLEALSADSPPALRLRGLSEGEQEQEQEQELRLLRGSELFDGRWYLAQNPDVAASGMDPAAHYLRFGAQEDRDPSPLFSTRAYRLAHPDLASSGGNPLTHCLRARARGEQAPAPVVPSRHAVEHAGCMTVGPEGEGAPRIVIVSGEEDTPGHVYRVERLANALASGGFQAHALALGDLPHNLGLIAGCSALIIWRAAFSSLLGEAVQRAHAAGAKVVFDIDDYMVDPSLARVELIDGIRSQGLDPTLVAQHYALVRQTLEVADACTCTTDALAKPLRQLHKPTFVIPNGFDEETYRTSRLAALAERASPGDGLIRLGYAAGSRTHQRDFAEASKAVARVLAEHEACRLVLFRRGQAATLGPDEFPALVGLEDRIEWREFVPLRQLPSEIARFDVNLAPLELGNPFAEAKSELKYFEAALVGVPTVASPTAPFKSAIRQGVTGLLASAEDDWYRSLKRLVTDAPLRRRMGRDALHDVLWRFGPERRAEIASTVMGQVLGTGRSRARLFELELARTKTPACPPPPIPEFDTVWESPSREIGEAAVVIPLYNYEQYIEEALDSVRAQTLSELDIVVVDDCSTDRSLDVAREWLEGNSQRFRRRALLKNRHNSGLALARNAGFAYAEAPFVMTLDADNKLLPDCVQRCLERLRTTGAAVAYPTIRTFGDVERTVSDREWSAAQFACGNYVDAMALIRKSAWAVVGGYEHVRHGWEDYDLWCKFVERGLWGVHVPEGLALYRTHRASMTQRQTTQPAHWRELLDRFERRYPWLDLSGLDRPAKDTRHFGANEPGTLDVAPATILPSPAALSDAVGAGISAGAPRRHDDVRLDELLAILRCPISGERLVKSSDELANASGSCRWPIRNGRPILFPGLHSVAERSDAHISNAIPARALAIIKDTAGLVLNLSAGGTEQWFPNVVEVEAGIFRNTDIVADAHRLPFVDGAFAAVVTLNAFEHFHDPLGVAAEIRRVLRPSGTLFVQTAFMQPLHEPPWHFYNCTKYGLLRWFAEFETLDIEVSDNFNPAYSISWLSHELEQALRKHLSAAAAHEFAAAPVGRFAEFWRQPPSRIDPVWQMFFQLPQEAQEYTAAGFEFVGRRPALDI